MHMRASKLNVALQRNSGEDYRYSKRAPALLIQGTDRTRLSTLFHDLVVITAKFHDRVALTGVVSKR